MTKLDVERLLFQEQPCPAPVPTTPLVRSPTSNQDFLLTPLSDLLTENEESVSWLVEQRLPSAGFSLVAGKPKAGKSTLARCLALAVARGEPFLGFSTQQGQVLYLALEEKRAEVRRHFQAMGAMPDDAIAVHIAPSPQDGLSKLRHRTEQERFALVIVDPLFKLVRVKDGNDYAAMSTALEPLLSLARDTGAHVLAVHHLGKGERDGGDGILCSTAIFAAVDTALLLKRTEKYRTLSSIQRYGEDLDEITLALDPETRAVSAGVSRREADVEAASGPILEFLKTQTELVEEPPIHEAVEGRKVIKQKALRRLVEIGKVARSGDGKRGKPYLYAFSGSLAPDICRESENQKPNLSLTFWNHDGNSGSSLSADEMVTPYPLGSVIRFKTGLGFEESDTIKKHTTWTQFPGQICYQVNGGRTVPHSWVVGLEG